MDMHRSVAQTAPVGRVTSVYLTTELVLSNNGTQGQSGIFKFKILTHETL